MTSLQIIIACYLNPILFTMFLLLRELFEPFGLRLCKDVGSNVIRIRLGHYLWIMPLLYSIWLVFDYSLLSSILPTLTLDTYFASKWGVLAYIAAAIVAFCLIFFLTEGMEMNVMGFIFMPFLFLAAGITVVLHIVWVWSSVIKVAL